MIKKFLNDKMIYVLLFIILLGLLRPKKEGFTDFEKNVSYPNVYDEQQKKIEEEYEEKRGPLTDYYNNQFYQYKKRDFIMKPQLPEKSLKHNIAKKISDKDVNKKAIKILNKIDSILTKMEKNDGAKKMVKKESSDIPSGAVSLKSLDYSKI